MDTEAENRHYCSNLISVRLPSDDGEREVVGNLEEIYARGAYLNVEEPIGTGVSLRLVCSSVHGKREFQGRVTECQYEALTGYYVKVEFSPGIYWSPEVFMPKHSVRVSSILSRESEGPSSNPSCCDRGVCPKEVISGIIEPEFPLSGRVRAVAQSVANLCGELTEDEAATCFGTLFGAGRECRLFAEFQDAYAEERKQGSGGRHKCFQEEVEGLVKLAGPVPTDVVRSESWPEPTE